MKKIVCLIIILASLLLVSCAGDAPVVYSTPTETVATAKTSGTTAATQDTTAAATAATATTATVETAATTASTTAEPTTASEATATTNANPYEPTTVSRITSGCARYSDNFKKQDVETPTKVIFSSFTYYDNGILEYFDKNDGEMHVFCGDPSCDHSFFSDEGKRGFKATCPAAMMTEMTNRLSNLTIAPLFIGGRVYFVCYSGLYSCTDAGGDLREEFKFGDNNNLQNELKKIQNERFAIMSVLDDGKNIFFCHIDDEKNIVQYRYDTSTRILYDMTAEMKKAEASLGHRVLIDRLADGKIYLAAYSGAIKPIYLTSSDVNNSDKPIGYYSTDYGFSSFEKVDNYIAAPDFIIDSGVIGKSGNDYVLEKYSGEKTVLIENSDDILGDNYTALYINDNYLYYVKDENLVIGKKESFYGSKINAVNKNGGKIYRYDLETGDIVCVFDNYYYDGFRAVYIDEESGVCFLAVEKYIELEEKFFDKKTVSVLVRCDINNDGTFNAK